MVENYKIIGINHQCSNKEYRELFFKDKDSIIQALKFLFLTELVDYSLILKTSNRLEFHLLTSRDDFALIIERLFKLFNLPNFEYFISVAYSYKSNQAVEHLFRIISSIDSEKLGDSQIISQVRKAFHLSDEIKNNTFMHRLLNAAIRASSIVRANTAIGEPIKSIAGVACSYIIKDIKIDEKIMFIGYDNVIKTIIIKLFEKGFTKLCLFPDIEIELPEPLKNFLIISPINNYFDTVAVVLNKNYQIENVNKNIKLIIDLGNLYSQKDDYVKCVTQNTLYTDIESMRLDKQNSLDSARNLIIKEVTRFEKQCNEDNISL
jgi:hypothetical protein